MKKILSLIFIMSTLSLCAQTVPPINERSPKIVCKVKPGEIGDFGQRSVKFIKVVSDSRCPKNVTCVWEGEATILLEIYKDQKLEERKKVVVSPGKEDKLLFSSGDKKVQIYSLAPYPVDNSPIKKENYVLNLIVAERLE